MATGSAAPSHLRPVSGGAAEAMSRTERVRAAVAGQTIDRARSASGATSRSATRRRRTWRPARSTGRRRFGFDLVKFMPPGDYPTIDWGAESRFEGAPGGTRTTTRYPIATDRGLGNPPPRRRSRRVLTAGSSSTRCGGRGRASGRTCRSSRRSSAR